MLCCIFVLCFVLSVNVLLNVTVIWGEGPWEMVFSVNTPPTFPRGSGFAQEGHQACKKFCSNTRMTVKKRYGHGVARGTTWATSAALEKTASEEPGRSTDWGIQKHDGVEPDTLCGSRLEGGGQAKGIDLRVGSANVGTLRGRYGEVVELAVRRRLDFCCLQETRWRGEGARLFGGCKLYWMGGEEGLAGVGVLVGERWVDKVIEVIRCSARLMVVRVMIGKTVLNLISVYVPQVGRSMNEKEEFYISLGNVLATIRNNEYLVVCGDFNGHVGKEVAGFEGVHGGFGFGSRNVEGEMLLEFADAWNLAVTNTWFKKDIGRLITYESGGNKTVVDYILIRKVERKLVRNVNVIPGEACLQQHKLLVCMLNLRENVRRRKEIFVSRCKIWKLKEERFREEYRQRVQNRARMFRRGGGGVDVLWEGLKECLVTEAEEVCGMTKGHQRHRETWWWNDEVSEVIKEKQRLYRIYDKSREDGRRREGGINEAKYYQAKREAKRVVCKAQEAERRKLAEELKVADGKGTLFRVAKQMVKKGKDVVGGGCVKNGDGRIVVEEDELMEVWRAHYATLANEEFSWDKSTLTEVDVLSGPSERISEEEVRRAVAKMKCNKAPGPSGVVADMLKSAGETCLPWVTEVCNAIVQEGKMPKDWDKSWMVNVYKGKGDALECGSYRGIKLLEHVMKVLERVIESRVRNIVKIDEMQFGFMSGKGTTDAIFIVRQLQEKYLAKNKELWMAFVDLEKAFDRVPREVVWWALRKLGVDEWIVSVIKTMYEEATTSVQLNGRESKGFRVKVGVHQGSVLSPLLFVIVLEALSREFRAGLPMELLYADDLVLVAETLELLKEKIAKWKSGMEGKGLRVNIGKTKVMRCCVKVGQVENSGKWPCGICKKGVAANSIQCTACSAWIHKRCSGVTGKLTGVVGFTCKRCVDGTPVDIGGLREVSIGQNDKLECVEKFCYLGDMIGSGGGAEEASRARVRCAWAKFRELSPILTARGASLIVKGKIYRACVQSVLVYGSETWAMKVDDMQRLERTERLMVRWMCSVSLKDRIPSKELNRYLGVSSVTDVVRRGRLRWFGHLERKGVDDWVSACRDMEVTGDRGRGRGRTV